MAEELELRATTAYETGDFDASVRAWEDLHQLHDTAGEKPEAARAAAMVALYLMMDTGLMAAVRGWLRRADRLVESCDDVPARALIAMTRTYERFMCGDMEAADRHATQAIELGERLGVQPAVVIGRVASARIRILHGEVEEGLGQLDEACALLMSGTVDPMTTGMMYCELICAAQGLGRLDLATEWTDAMERWRHGAAVGGINGRCRVHRAELLRMWGTCDDAEAEALRACEELRPWMRREYGWPLVELGNIRMRKGDLDAAEEAYLAALDHAWSPQPGLALLRAEQGDLDAAAELIAEAIAHPFDIPWKERPPFGELQMAPLLAAQVEIAFEADDATTARRAADRLATIARDFQSTGIDASTALASARAALLEDDLDTAIARAAASVSAWTELGAPFEAAVSRTVLGQACAASNNGQSATMHWLGARAAFERFGAQGWVERIDKLLGATSTRSMPANSERDATFRLDGDVRTVAFAGTSVQVRDLKGYRYIDRLLAEPGRELHVLDLVSLEQGHAGPGATIGREADRDGELGPDTGAGMPAIDEHAREAYRRRLEEVEADIDDAHANNDLARLELATRDRDYLVDELARAVGLGGRIRTVGGDAERARTSVTRTIRYALGRLATHHPAAAAHLEQSTQTGIYCAYRPDPTLSIEWRR